MKQIKKKEKPDLKISEFSFAFIFILNSVIINSSFNYTKHDKYEVKIFF